MVRGVFCRPCRPCRPPDRLRRRSPPVTELLVLEWLPPITSRANISTVLREAVYIKSR
jgi:hypothetical protein